MKSLWVLGNGQLGQMLRQAAEPLGVKLYPLGFDDPIPQLPTDAVITTEIEQWSETALTRQLTAHAGFTNAAACVQLADRLTQKQLLDQLDLATAPWAVLNSPEQWPVLFDQLGTRLVIKRRRGGYDGRGQWRIDQDNTEQLPRENYGQAIVEQNILFTGEVSLVGARNRSGRCLFYPLVHTLHQQGILRASVALPTAPSLLQQQAEQMLHSLMQHLDYVGVMAMECFVMGEKLLINELAPRVHNSGHWTQDGATISQFELHVRALLDWPLPTALITLPSVMINLIGTDFNPDWLSLSLVRLHWYNKTVRIGRKVGHLNITHPHLQQLQQTLQKLLPLLDHAYQGDIDWAQQQLKLARSFGLT